MWRPTRYSDEDFGEFREALDDSRIDSATIHAVYLINCASREREIRRKSITSSRMLCGSATESVPMVSSCTPELEGEPPGPSMKRAAAAIRASLADSDAAVLLGEHRRDPGAAGEKLRRARRARRATRR